MKLDIIGKRKIFFGISIVALVLVLIITIVVGPKLDIQFKAARLPPIPIPVTLLRTNLARP